MLGNGDELKRDAIPVDAPSKPPRTASFKGHNAINQEKCGRNHENPPNDQQQSEKSESHKGTSTTTAASEEAATSVAAEKESLPLGGANVGDIPAIKLSDNLGSRSIEASSKSPGSMENSLPVVHKSEAATGASAAIPNDHVPTSAVDESVAKEHSDDRAQSGERQAESQGREAQNQDGGQDRNATTQVHNEKPSDHDTKVQNHTIEAQVHNDVVHNREGAHTQDAAPTQSEMKSVKEESESTKPITATAITTTTTSTTADVMMENSTEKATTNQINESHSNSTTPKESESESKPNGSAGVVEDQQPTRKSSFGTSKSFRAEDSLFETALLLGKLPSCRSVA